MNLPTLTAPARFDIYRDVHKGLRAFMADTLVALARMDSDDAEDTRQTLSQLQDLLHILSAHIRHENEHVHAAIEARRPGLAARIAEEHIDHHQAILVLLKDIDALHEASDSATRRAAALRLYRRFAVFVGENLEHMHVEETAHNAALWSAYTDAEIIGIHDMLLRAVEPAQMRVFLRWIVPHLAHAERVEMLGAMRAAAPAEAFEQVLGLARQHMRARDWDKLANALALTEALA